MMVLALERDKPDLASADFAPHLQDEARVIWKLIQAGAIREIYFREHRSEAVIMLEAADASAARELLAQLPLVRQGLIEFEVIGLQPYPGLCRLFKE